MPSSPPPQKDSSCRSAAARPEEVRVVHIPTTATRGVVLLIACVVVGAIMGFGADKLLHAHSVAGVLEMAGVAAGLVLGFRKGGGRELVLRESGALLRRGERVLADVPWSSVVWRSGYSSMTARSGTYYYPTHELTLGTVKLRLTGLVNHVGERHVELPIGDMIGAVDEPLLRKFLVQHASRV